MLPKLTKKEIRGIVGFSGLSIGAWMYFYLQNYGWWIVTLISLYVIFILKEKRGKWVYWKLK